MSIYEKIDYLLRQNNLKQNDMCETINVPTSTYSSMKQRNSKSISIDVIRNIAVFFNISIDYFLNNEIKKEDYKKFFINISNESGKEILEKYKMLNENYKEVTLNLINSLLDIQEKE